MQKLQRLYLLRHAQALPARVEQFDFDRVLSEKGRNEAEKIGEIIKTNYQLPDCILLSPSKRTRETAEYINLFEKSDLILVDALYEGSTKDYLDAISEAERFSNLLLIGHNPAIFAVLQYLASPQSNIKVPNSYPTAGLAIIDFSMSKSKLSPQSGLLTAFHHI